MGEGPRHRPVMPTAVAEWLVQRPGGLFLDATVGAGGHALAILESAGPAARLVAVDQDPEALVAAAETLEGAEGRVIFRQGNFAQIGAILDALGIGPLDGAVFDLGVSSRQLDAASRGFSFQREGPLDMRMDPAGPRTAAELVNRRSEAELADLLARYGQERYARRIARAIVRHRPVTTTTALAACVLQALPRGRRWTRIHPATRTFQGLRIAVNDELASLERAMPEVIQRLRPGARVAVLAYHSLEDRIVKQAFRRAAAEGILAVVTRRPLRPGPDERRANPRARSACLRVGERVG